MKMKRLLSILLVSIITLGSAIGCGTQTDNSELETEVFSENKNENIELETQLETESKSLYTFDTDSIFEQEEETIKDCFESALKGEIVSQIEEFDLKVLSRKYNENYSYRTVLFNNGFNKDMEIDLEENKSHYVALDVTFLLETDSLSGKYQVSESEIYNKFQTIDTYSEDYIVFLKHRTKELWDVDAIIRKSYLKRDELGADKLLALDTLYAIDPNNLYTLYQHSVPSSEDYEYALFDKDQDGVAECYVSNTNRDVVTCYSYSMGDVISEEVSTTNDVFYNNLDNAFYQYGYNKEISNELIYLDRNKLALRARDFFTELYREYIEMYLSRENADKFRTPTTMHNFLKRIYTAPKDVGVVTDFQDSFFDIGFNKIVPDLNRAINNTQTNISYYVMVTELNKNFPDNCSFRVDTLSVPTIIYKVEFYANDKKLDNDYLLGIGWTYSDEDWYMSSILKIDEFKYNNSTEVFREYVQNEYFDPVMDVDYSDSASYVQAYMSYIEENFNTDKTKFLVESLYNNEYPQIYCLDDNSNLTILNYDEENGVTFDGFGKGDFIYNLNNYLLLHQALGSSYLYKFEGTECTLISEGSFDNGEYYIDGKSVTESEYDAHFSKNIYTVRDEYYMLDYSLFWTLDELFAYLTQ